MQSKSNGFSLVEVTLAIGVAAISLIAIFGLLPVGLQTNHNAIEQSAATDILADVIADLKATAPTNPRGGGATSGLFGIAIPGNPVSANTQITMYFTSEGLVVSSANASRYRLTITFPPNGKGARTSTFVDLKMTWPGAAAPANATGSAEVFAALDRN
jgi:uncharacterized protein (TIGR02598 family)